MATTTAIFLFLFLGLPYLIAEYLRAVGSDWPATCTPFEGEAQRWKRERGQADETAGREWGEVADIPPMSQDAMNGSDDVFTSALENQPDFVHIARPRALNKVQTETEEFDLDTLQRQKDIIEKRKLRNERLKKYGLKMETLTRKDQD